MKIFPTAIQLDACSVCQLECPLCPSTEGILIIGKGSLAFEDFKKLIDRNPWIREVCFANKGEIFLNKELAQILQYAYGKNVSLNMNHGVNLNHASEETLEALVRYQIASLRVSIDGITQETYQRYRVGGNLKRVIENIRRINHYKAKYHSSKPALVFQFIPFGHNEHEMEGARLLARLLNMQISFRLNRMPDVFAVQDHERVMRYVGYVDRDEYLARNGKNYLRCVCYQMWNKPYIAWNGKLFGCCQNVWGIYSDNVFVDNLVDCINNEKMQYARELLMGSKPPRTDIPCLKCRAYRDMLEYGNWITESEVLGAVSATAD
jgi:MoaA/NifB/PqqE/SkfB family radical SAM enzyme